MLEPNNYYLAINKLDKEYDVLTKFNWFNLKKLIHDIKKYKPNNSLDLNNELTYRELYQNFVLGHHISQFEKNIKPYLIKFINNNFTERIKNYDADKNTKSNSDSDFEQQCCFCHFTEKLEPQLSGLIFEIIKSRHIIYYNINTEEKLKGLVETKMSQIEEGFTFYNDIYNVITDNITLKDLITIIKKHKKIKIKKVSNKIMNQLSYEVSDKKINELGFKPKGNIGLQIKKTLLLFNGLNL